MDQLVQELKLFKVSDELRKKQDCLSILGLINDPIFVSSSSMSIPSGDSSTFYELKNVNFIFLYSKENFNLVIDDSVVMNLKEFVFVNEYRQISVAIQCLPSIDQRIDFVYGNTRLGDEGAGMGSIGKSQCAAKWDRVLKNIILKIDPATQTVGTVFPPISNLAIGGSNG